ncbi:MAG: hypothetical protein HYY37_05085 [Candidatus Aenigmarchaeota archaeon]|nr:hypothetical protein [Candidatus Aenigmarchaeota archaeon]
MVLENPVRKQENKVLRVKLPNEEFVRFASKCTLHDRTINSKLRELANEYAESGSVSHVFGRNTMEYNPKADNFSWKIISDAGDEKTILEDVPADFLRDLHNRIKAKLHERDELLQCKSRKSVPVPRRLLR